MANPLPFLEIESCIVGLTSLAHLRTVCKAWCRAIDTTPEISRYICMHSHANNITHVVGRDSDPNGLFKCLITAWNVNGEVWMRSNLLTSSLRAQVSESQLAFSAAEMNVSDRGTFWVPVFPRLRKLALIARDNSTTQFNPSPIFCVPDPPHTLALGRLSFEVFEPRRFFGVQVLTMVDAAVSHWFVTAFNTFLSVASRITEINLQSL